MKVTTTGPDYFFVEFESREEFDKEYETNLSAGGISFPTTEKVPEFTRVRLTLKVSQGEELDVGGMVVRVFDAALAIALDVAPELIRAALAERSPMEVPKSSRPESNSWDKVRQLSRMEKLLLAAKAEKSERAVLLQDKDPQILYALLKNPRISTEEVLRIARSTLLSSMAADLIAKTTLWVSNGEIRTALVQNARTPTSLAMKLLPTLPDPEIRQIAKSNAVSQALKQAALRIVINRQ